MSKESWVIYSHIAHSIRQAKMWFSESKFILARLVSFFSKKACDAERSVLIIGFVL